MNHIKIKAALVFVFISQLILTGCQRDPIVLELSAPVLSDVSIGLGNSKVAYVGSDLHVGAIIKADARVHNVKVQVTPKNAGHGWVVSETFTEGFKGVKNAEFHEHFDIPALAKQGLYDFLLIVTDENGKRTEIVETIEVIYDPELPAGTNLKATFKAPSTITLTGQVEAKNKVKEFVLQFMSSGNNKRYVLDGEGITGLTSITLNKDVDISEIPNGHHHFIFEIHDESGRKAAYELHFDNF